LLKRDPESLEEADDEEKSNEDAAEGAEAFRNEDGSWDAAWKSENEFDPFLDYDGETNDINGPAPSQRSTDSSSTSSTSSKTTEPPISTPAESESENEFEAEASVGSGAAMHVASVLVGLLLVLQCLIVRQGVR
jgi:hypothetical protein